MLTYMHRLKQGESCIVERIELSQPLEERLRDFGLVSGTKAACRYKSPDSCVTALEFRGTVLALRTRDLRGIRVKLS